MKNYCLLIGLEKFSHRDSEFLSELRKKEEKRKLGKIGTRKLNAKVRYCSSKENKKGPSSALKRQDSGTRQESSCRDDVVQQHCSSLREI